MACLADRQMCSIVSVRDFRHKSNDNAGALATWYNLDHDNTRGFEFSLNHQYKIGEVNYFVGGNMSWSRTRKGTLSTEDLQAVMTNGNGTLKDIGITYVGDITVLDVISRMEK